MNSEEIINQLETKLDLMWDKIQELKHSDIFAAQILYEKYKMQASELPPPIKKEMLDEQCPA